MTGAATEVVRGRVQDGLLVELTGLVDTLVEGCEGRKREDAAQVLA